MEKFEKLKALVADTEDDAAKFYTKNNAAAGVRVRKKMQEIKLLVQDIRKEVQDKKNAG